MASNRARYKCINVDHETYRVIRSLSIVHRRSLLEQVRVMAENERSNLKPRQPISDERRKGRKP